MIVSAHAVKRYIERIRPEMDAIAAAMELYSNLIRIVEILGIDSGTIARIHYCGVSYVVKGCEKPVLVTVYQDRKKDIKHLRDHREAAFLR